mmetsp:Transcript_17483/g.44565  ORF Transcript_17483/g.44565 Transcript_17483/m.44565 type:complete len:250 (+) Transcript_17483:67-816(+)
MYKAMRNLKHRDGACHRLQLHLTHYRLVDLKASLLTATARCRVFQLIVARLTLVQGRQLCRHCLLVIFESGIEIVRLAAARGERFHPPEVAGPHVAILALRLGHLGKLARLPAENLGADEFARHRPKVLTRRGMIHAHAERQREQAHHHDTHEERGPALHPVTRRDVAHKRGDGAHNERERQLCDHVSVERALGRHCGQDCRVGNRRRVVAKHRARENGAHSEHENLVSTGNKGALGRQREHDAHGTPA